MSGCVTWTKAAAAKLIGKKVLSDGANSAFPCRRIIMHDANDP